MFRYMFDVIFVTHKSMMKITTPTLWTPHRYATVPYLLCVPAVPVLLKYDDDVSTIAPNLVRESGFVYVFIMFSFGN